MVVPSSGGVVNLGVVNSKDRVPVSLSTSGSLVGLVVTKNIKNTNRRYVVCMSLGLRSHTSLWT